MRFVYIVCVLGLSYNILNTKMKIQFQALAGDNVGALLRGIKLKSVDRGMLVCAVGSEKLSNRFRATVYFLTKSEGGRSKPILTKYIQQLFSKTWSAPCRVDLGD